ncbi:MAG: hypothetical protein ACYDB7_00295 [Mycobacteriales bacterium]
MTTGRRPAQATIRTFESSDCSGTALLDDGTLVAFPGRAFAASGLRRLRIGQRVRVEWSAGEVALVTVVTLPDPSTTQP